MFLSAGRCESAIQPVGPNLGLEHLPRGRHARSTSQKLGAGAPVVAHLRRKWESIDHRSSASRQNLFFMRAHLTRGSHRPAVQNCTLCQSIFVFIASAPILSMLERDNRARTRQQGSNEATGLERGNRARARQQARTKQGWKWSKLRHHCEPSPQLEVLFGVTRQ
jgi:hypothetical protein